MQGTSEFPISITEKAVLQMLKIRDGDSDLGKDFAVRISCKGGGCSGIMYNLDFDNEIEDDDLKTTITKGDLSLTVVTDPHSASYLEGLTVDFVREGLTEGFKFEGGAKVKRTCGCGMSFSV